MDGEIPVNNPPPSQDSPESLIKQLQQEKSELEKDFGIKRAKFKELFIQKEDELKRERERCLASDAKVTAMEAQLKSMKEEMDKVQWELEGVKTAAAVAETNRQEEINSIAHTYQQEVASLQQLLQEAAKTASDNTAAQYESERNKLVSLNENYEEEIQELRNKLSQEREEGFLSTVAKSIKRVGAVTSGNTSLEHENLEESMRKAQEDANILKSVVVPLEQEIKMLKQKLEVSEAKLADVEDKLHAHQGSPDNGVGDDSGERKSPSLSDLENVGDPADKVDKLYHYLKAEKAARKDLEMYVAVLSTQKSVLQDEADKIKDELEDVCRILEEEKQSHDALKQTWQMANDQFLESQRLLMMDLRRMEGVLTTEQQRQIADLKREYYNKPRKKSLSESCEQKHKSLSRHRSAPVFSSSNGYKNTTHSNHNHGSKQSPLTSRKNKTHEWRMPKPLLTISDNMVSPRAEQVMMHPRTRSQRIYEEPHFSKQLQQKDETREAQERKVKELGEKREKQEKEQEERRKLSQSRMEKERSKANKSSVESPVKSLSNDSECLLGQETYGAASSLAMSGAGAGVRRSMSSSEISDLREDDDDDEEAIFLDSGLHDTQSLNETDGGGRDSTDGIHVRISPEKILHLPSLSAAQMKAITDPTPESEAHKSLVASVRSKTGKAQNLEGKRMVSEREWALLQEEMRASREKLGRPCSMCSNYEAQLQSVQEEHKKSQTEVKRLERALATEQQTNQNLTKNQSELEEALKNAAEDAQSQITHLSNKVMDCEKYVEEFKQQVSSTHLQLQDYCKSLTENREEAQKELIKLQEENDSLVDKYSKTAQQLQNEDINLPNNLEEMQLLLLKYREEIISAKVAKEHIEETLRSEIVFLKSQVIGEQQEKATLEETLTQEISSLQAKVEEVESLKKELEQESTSRAESETRLRESEASLKSIQTKSKQLISKMQEKLEEMDKRKSKLEAENHSLKGKVQSLQVDLDNSEAVQRDFVKLSQSLQIQLEKIRQAETEVRWQYEEDVDDCSNCKQPFSVTKRKHHCKHCGKIFCAECTTKTVNSGPKFRSAKVCDVCHTILVKDATPYFSSEPPATPD